MMNDPLAGIIMAVTVPINAIQLTPGSVITINNLTWQDFGSTTFKRPEIAGVEPDSCLYIQNASQMQGCTQMDLDIYPPPDLAIESDVTSKTTLDIYAAIGVPEVWIYSKKQLKIYIFDQISYKETSTSLIFPNLSLTTLIPQLIEQAINQGTSRMLRTLRSQFNPN